MLLYIEGSQIANECPAKATAKDIHDGNSVAMRGFTQLIPFAAGNSLFAVDPRSANAKVINTRDQWQSLKLKLQ